MRALVTGGAGYIGSHMVLLLNQLNWEVVVLDNLTSGHKDAVVGGDLVVGDIDDDFLVSNLLNTFRPDIVFHFAGAIEVAESMEAPAKYYDNNLFKSVGFLNTLMRYGIKYFVFSSSAAVYAPSEILLSESTATCIPQSPYGRSKFMLEQVLTDYDYAYGLRSVALRYFNAAGSDPAGRLGERHNPESHLIPKILQNVQSNIEPTIDVYGLDYPTRDGSCIRDYVHVLDICEAHVCAATYLLKGGKTQQINIGIGHGTSVLEIVRMCEEVTGRTISINGLVRRPGDSPQLVADPRLANSELNWFPLVTDVREMIQHAWKFINLSNPRSAKY